ncbi:MAG TPA: TPM domain-containing protein [Planctomycetaceae bacterium]|nr:TPM domain-containing protein [Planctomycetaceae bacterium]
MMGSATTRWIRPGVSLWLFLVLSSIAGMAQTDIPLAPTADDLVRDTVLLIQKDDLDHIRQVQRSAYDTHDTPIVVVTIAKVPPGEDIESLAMQWFNEWEIGKRKPNGQLVNQGILLLVAVVDRKARIELGADWGRRWDDHAQQIMDEVIIPQFRKGKYSKGIRAGVDALAAMAAMGPDGRPGRRRSLSGILRSKPDPLISPLPVWGSLLMGAAGVALLIFGLRDYKKYRTVIIIGGFLLAGAIVFWMTLFAIGVIFGGGRSRGSSYGGFSGGSFGGGFSGGGGATGSW